MGWLGVLMVPLVMTGWLCAAIPSAERAALIALYNDTSGDSWHDNTGWKEPPLDTDGFAMPGTEGGWFGVTVASDHVTFINIGYNNLAGALPPEIGDFPQLTNLWIYGNNLPNPIPTQIGNLANLANLQLYENGLTGGIPAEIGFCTNLTYMTLSGNQLAGSIPAELGNCTALTVLHLISNQLTGELPAALAGLVNLQQFYVANNDLDGNLPAWLGTLTNLQELDMSGNAFTGSLPVEWSNLVNLRWLILNDNQFNGTIPTWIDSLAALEILDLSNNPLLGSIPADMGALTNLWSLNLTHCQLTGNIPTEIGNLSLLEELYLGQNQLDGAIPTQLGDLLLLQMLFLDENQLNGTLPAELGNLTDLRWLALDFNLLDGSLPAWLGGLSNLEHIGFGENDFSGSIPSEWGWLTNLNFLDLVGNGLTGSLPIELSNLTNLQWLFLSGNEISGTIPAWLGTFVHLEHLHLGGNQFLGSIPTQIGNLSQLRQLYLEQNQLEGGIPTQLGDLPNLEYLYLYSNQLTGHIPTQLGNLTSLRELLIGTNQLDGPIPYQLADIPDMIRLNVGGNQLTGGIPTALGTMAHLEDLVLWDNDLTGGIPTQLGNITTLQRLGLSANPLGGTLPAELANLANLTELYLADDDLTGGLPAWIGSLSQLRLLNVSGNSLAGPIPSQLGNVPALEQLYLWGNMFSGEIPTSLTNLVNLWDTETDIGYNALFTNDPSLQTFLDGKDPDWANTQTVAPTNVTATPLTNSSVRVAWDPIPYTGDDGHYGVYVSTTPGSGYSPAGTTPDKSTAFLDVTGLTPSTPYYFVVETVTEPHGQNDNQLVSEFSQEAATATPAATVTVLSPNGGEDWPAGSVQSITWSTSGTVGDVRIEYSTDSGGFWSEVVAATANDGAYDWTVPDNPSDHCLVRIYETDGDPLDVSDGEFTLSPPLPTITVTSPNGGEIWSVGLVHEITWTSSEYLGDVTIEYSTDGGGFWFLETGATNDDGSYLWITPFSPSEQCWVRVSRAAEPWISDESDWRFTLTDQDDAYEENDDQAAAVDIIPGVYSNLRHIMDGWGTMDADWFRVWVVGGQDLRVNVNGYAMNPGGSDDMDFELRDAGGALLAAALSSSGNETLYLRDVSGGWYYIGVTYGQNTIYTLTVEIGSLPLGTISGTVTDAWGAGIEGVWVIFYDLTGSWESLYGYALTDSAGNYAFHGLAADYIIYFDTHYPNLNYLAEYYDDSSGIESATAVPIFAEQTTAGIDAILAEGGMVSGHVTDGLGNPLASVGARAYDTAGVYVHSVFTDDNGDYIIRGLPPGDCKIWFRRSGNFAFEWYDDQVAFGDGALVPVTAGGETAGIDAVLEEQGFVAGRVTEGGGAGIPDVRVCAYDASDHWFWDGWTDGDGNYTVGHLPTSDVRIWFDAAGTNYSSEWYDDQPDIASAALVPVVQGQTTPDIDAVLAPRSIQLTAPNGGEIWSVGLVHDITWSVSGTMENVRIEFSDDDGSNWSELVASTPNDGVYEWDTLAGPAAYCRLRVSDAANAGVFDDMDDWFTLTDQDDLYEENDSQAAAVELTAGVYPGLRMVVDDWGRPDPDWFRVWLDNGDDLRVTINATALGPTAREDIDFELRNELGALLVGTGNSIADEVACLADMPAGWYYIATNYANTLYEYTLTIETGALDVGLITGRVTDEYGAGIPDLWVHFYNPQAQWDYQGYVLTNTNGNYRFAGGPGDYHILYQPEATNLNYLSEWFDDQPTRDTATPVGITSGGVTAAIDAELAAGGSISGTITTAGSVPLDRALVKPYLADGTRLSLYALTAPDGTYVLNGIPPGDVKIKIAKSGYTQQWYDNQAMFADATVLSMSAGSVFTNIDAELGSNPGGISGRVTNEFDEGIAGVYWIIFDPANALISYGTTDGDGNYTAVGYPSGNYKVVFNGASTVYASEWYDDQPDFDHADLVPVVEGSVTPGIDAVLTPRTIQLTSPNGGEIWTVGLAHEITWLANDDVDGVRIEFSDDDGANWSELVASTPNDGVFEWDTLVGPAAYCRIRVSDAANPDVFDDTDDWFTLTDQDDMYEENDSQSAAVDLTPGIYPDLRMVVDDQGRLDPDWFRVWLDAGEDLRVNINATQLAPDQWVDIDFELRDETGRLLRGTLSSSADETLCLADMPAGWYYIVTSYAGVPYEYTLTIERGALDVGLITGRVTDEYGAGIPDLWIEVWDPTGSGVTMHGYLLTDTAGDYRFADVAGDYMIYYRPDRTDLNFLVEWYNDQPAFATATPVTVTAGGITAPVDAQLATGGIISGQVTVSGGAPLQYALARAYSVDGTTLRQTWTGEDGTYVLSGVAPGDVKVLFARGGYGLEWYDDQSLFADAAVLSVTAGVTLPDIDAELSTPPGGISGRVTNGEGAGIANIFVFVYDPANVQLNQVSTDADGYYTVGSLPTGSFKVWFRAWETIYESEWYDNQPDFGSAGLVPVTAGATTTGIDAVLVPRTVTVTAPNGGEIWSVGQTCLITWDWFGVFPSVRIDYSLDGGSTWIDITTSTTDNDGVYEWVPPPAVSNNCLVRVRHHSHDDLGDTSDEPFMLTDQDDIYEENDSQAAAVELTAGVYTGLRMVVDDQLRLDPDWFRVWLDAGQDLRVTIDATLIGTTDWDDIDFELRDDVGDLLVGALSSSTSETLCLADMPAGWVYIVTNFARGLYDYTLAIETGDLDVGLITGQVTDEYGIGIPDLRIEFPDPSLDHDYHHGYVRTDSNGDYRFAGHPGDYLVYYRPEVDNMIYLREWYDDQPTEDTATPVSIVTGGVTAPIDAELATGGSISGTVTQSGGAPLYWVRVRAYLPGGTVLRTVRTGTDGTYVMNSVAPGDVRVQFAKGDVALEWYDDQALFADATVLPVTLGSVFTNIDAELDTSPGGISGRVTDDLGTGIANVNVNVYDPANVPLWTVTTDGDGYYGVGLMPAGDFKVWFDASATAFESEWYDDQADFASADPVTVLVGQNTPDIDAVLAPRTIEVTAPNGGEIWSVGQTHDITWLASPGMASVRIEFSDDDGGTWSELAGSTPNDGVFEWDTLVGPAAYCRIRISDAVNGGIFDDSDDWFTLTDQDDMYEENDSQATAVALTSGMYANLRMVVDSLGRADPDWFRIWLDAGQDLRVTINASPLEPDTWANMDLQFRDETGQLLAATWSTDADEILCLADMPAGWYYIIAYNALSLNDYTLTVETGILDVGLITGRVTDQMAAGIANLPVNFFDPSLDWALFHGCVWTDVNGDYRFAGNPGDVLIMFEPEANNLNYIHEWYDDQPTSDTAAPVTITAGGVTAPIDAQLAPGATITGLVTDGVGWPMQDVCVQAFATDGTYLATTWTGADGIYVLNGMATADVKVMFSKSGYGLEWYDNQALFADAAIVSVTAGGTVSGIDAVLGTPPGAVSGRVTNEGDEGIGDIYVFVYDPSNIELSSGVTDGDGYYSVNMLPAGDLKVWFCAWNTLYQSEWYDDQPDFGSAHLVPVSAGATTSDVNAVLAPRTITVTAPNGGEIWSVGQTCLITWDWFGEFPYVCIDYSLDGGSSWIDITTPTTDNDGVYEWTPPPDVSSDCLVRVRHHYRDSIGDTSDGPFTLTDQDDAYEENDSQAAAVELTAGVYPDLRLVLDDQGRQDPDWFKVWLDAGQDLQVTLSVTPLEPTELVYILFELCDDAGGLLVRSRSYPSLQPLCLADMPAGWYYIHIVYYEVRYAYDLTIETGALDVGLITGRVTDEFAAGIADLQVRFPDLSITNDLHHGYVMTDANGDYRFAGPVGDYAVRFYPEGANMNYVGEWYDDQPIATPPTPTPVAITAGGVTPFIDAELATGGILSGHVTDTLGQPFPSAAVAVYEAGYAMRRGYTDANGDYLLRGIKPGAWPIAFWAGEDIALEWYDDRAHYNDADLVTITTGVETTGIDAVLEPAAYIAGRVTDSLGAGIPHFLVVVCDPSGMGSGCWTDADGYYQYGWLSTGAYKVGFGSQQTVYAKEWYDNQPDRESADLVNVTQGIVTTGIDAQLALCELAITGHPQNQQVTAGQAATLSVTALSEPPLSYQWYEGYAPDTSHPVSGATDPALVTPPLAATTSYWVHVSNGCQEVDSTTATVWVVGTCEPPAAPALSVPGTVGNGQVYTITWTGTSPLGTCEIQEATAPDFSGAAAWLVTGTGFQQSHVVAADTYYYYRVRAYVTCNGSRLDSPWSDVQHVAVLFGALEPADLDGNGLITAEDLMLLTAFLCGDIDLVNGGDLNGDGGVDATDLSYMLHFLTGTFK